MTSAGFPYLTWHDVRVSSPSTRVRRPIDLARLLLAIGIGAAIFVAGNLAAQTTTGLESDFVQATRLLPAFIIAILTAISGTLAVLLPAAFLILGLVERKIRLLLEAHLAALIAITAAILSNNFIAQTDSTEIYAIFVGGTQVASAPPINTLLAATLAMAVVLRLTERRIWSILIIGISATLAWSVVLAGSATLIAQVLSAIGGITAGLLVRTLLGTPSTRPSLSAIVNEIYEFGLAESDLIEVTPTLYRATLSSGQKVILEILDRDADRAGFLSSFWRTLRLRGIESGVGLAMRSKAERLMLANLAAKNAGIATADLYAVKEISADAIVLVREDLQLSEITSEITDLDQVISQVWQELNRLHQADIAHRHATLDSFGLKGNKVMVVNLDSAVIAASKLLMALDVAELLLATSQLVGANRAVALATQSLSNSKVFYAARLLQPIAMSATSRANLRANKSSLSELRTALADLGFDPEQEQLNIERLKPRTILLLTISVAAGYAILNQLAEVNLINLFTSADGGWVIIAIGFSALTYVGATFALTAFSPTRISWIKTMLAHLAGSFITLITPSSVGAVSLNVRYLQRSGLTSGAAGATVAMSQVTMLGTHLIMLIVVSVIAGTSTDLSFDPPRWVILTITLTVALLILLFTIPFGRNWFLDVTANLRKQMVPAFVKVVSEPRRLLIASVSGVAMNLAYIFCLVASIRAFGESTEFVTVAFIYLAGATLGSLAPTPGGLGAVEAVLVAALTAGGLSAGTAISVTLLYRLATFWLPVIPGWLSFNYLTRIKSL